ncbi:MAG: glycosyl hydrolase 115 family protein [Duganella sp.]
MNPTVTPGAALRRVLQVLGLSTMLASALPAAAATLYDGEQVAAIVHDSTPTATLAARLLARDLQALSGQAPAVSTQLEACTAVCVVIAGHDTALARSVAAQTATPLQLDSLGGAWERYRRVVAPARTGKTSYVLIAGSDARGAVWGVIDLTRELGVSAWEWWADVTPRRQSRITISDTAVASRSPSVQYRGIFLNDEDWGLQPWAAKTYDRQAKDIGPATYARIYELLWRLKANTIWPAMHDSTKPFYQIDGNPEMARDYAIVVGTSHAEPMMRNNVREWRSKEDGAFNFFTNRQRMLDYWRTRAEQVKDYDNFYSLGLRGVHDSPMEGAATPQQARDAVAEVIGLQRGILAQATGKAVQQIPQALTLYKEVLDVYKSGLQVPDDVTLVWPDNNYGYLAQLSTPQERARSGGAGIYYHLSYWGRPHDYLWLGTTHPALVREQLDRTWQTGADKLWIVNVGDIKPIEYLTDYFLDLAFDHRQLARTPSDHLRNWFATQFGDTHAAVLAALQREFYDLAWERRPEFMGFGQTEPTTPNGINAYLRTGGEEARRRLARYEALRQQAEQIGAALPADRQDAYFELVLYPIRAAARLNQRILSLELAAALARQGQAGAQQQVEHARAAHAALVADTAQYNALANGKWRHMMDLAPRRLPVFHEPVFPTYPAPAKAINLPVNKVVVTSLAATSAAPNPAWEIVPELGSKGGSLRSRLSLPSVADGQPPNALALTWNFEQKQAGGARIKLVAAPVHPLTASNSLRIGVRIDDGPLEVLDFRTFGRSDEWKQNVLSNSAVRMLVRPQLEVGRHTISVYALDPGFILDRVDIVPDGAPDYYGAPPAK